MKKLIVFLISLIIVLLIAITDVFGSIDASCVWEFRPGTGSADNGGGYTSGGTDYSQQTNPVLDLTDFSALDASGSTLTTATGGFTAAMVGNIIYLEDADDNLTEGWYEIIAYTSSTEVSLDRDCTDGDGGNMTGGDGKVGGCLDIMTDAFCEQLTPGNDVYIQDDNTAMTLAASLSVENDGTETAPITIEGYKSSRGDNPAKGSGDQPVITCAANAFTFDDYWVFRNLNIDITETYGLYPGLSCVIENCDINQSGSGTRYAVHDTGGSKIIDCELQAANGRAVRARSDTAIINCYIHDSTSGIYFDSDRGFIAGNVIDTCPCGIDINSRGLVVVLNNTIYGSTGHAISGTSGAANLFINNIFDACAVGVEWTTPTYSNYFNYNCWDCTDDIVDTDVVAGSNAVSGDPGLTDPSADPPDFTLGSGSNCIDAGMQVATITGILLGDYKVNIGADQDDNTTRGRVAGANLGGALQN